MAYTVGNFGMSLTGDMSFNNINSNIINDKDNQVSFVNPAGNVDSIFTSESSMAVASTNAVNVLQIVRSAGEWGGVYIECIISGVHNPNAGFSIKYECMLRTSFDGVSTRTNAIYQSTTAITSGSTLTRTAVGTSSSTAMPTLKHITSGVTTTFSVTPSSALSGYYTVVFRILNGSDTNYNYTVL